MQKLSWILGAIAVFALSLTSSQPVQAANFKAPVKMETGDGALIEARGGGKRRYRGSQGSRGSRNYRGGGRRYSNNNYKRRPYRPRRGYGYNRPGYYYGYGGNVAVGIIGGAIIGGLIAEGTRRSYDNYGYSNEHYRWCQNRYRSYKVQSNTWVAYSGRVNQCASPYN